MSHLRGTFPIGTSAADAHGGKVRKDRSGAYRQVGWEHRRTTPGRASL